ncbi:hypothetical protein PHSY_003343 [Pseudozyma hubeiensis SY62]|uniref:N-acetyltransferase domain-containing protein n=1 Tax=Pseudozyma hubeiensis (strain SY62) TaxID=1305764 RepID=R9P3D8_PSEHS|nr:hypothetical protein PHSY_003343 [Pseudozyma hubeiensis SY62]GAC95767.1 hypothetical protein PHSY_003343 [Pseudozyma hubeiensis SY62]
MSFDAGSTFQEQMAGPSRPRFTGWLAMAPEVDPPRPAPATTTTDATRPAPLAQAHSSSESAGSEKPVASTHGFGYLGQQVKLPQRKKRRATFQVGSPGLSEDEAGSSSSHHSSRASSDDPEFDVRASFAPMPAYGKNRPSAQLSTYRGVGDQNRSAYAMQSDTATIRGGAADPADSSSDDDTDGLSFGGRRWKGKTVHAVEQELEALRDERLMSHAPDAAYLASRLEGVRRNLEIEERTPNYVPYDEDMLTDDDEASLAPHASEVVRQLYPFQHASASADVASAMPHRPVSNASSVSLVEGETPHDLDFGLQFDPAASYSARSDDVKVLDPDQVSMPAVSQPLAPTSAKTIDPAARAAALDARIEVRTLRRGDLEQVRDLHSFHGDSDRSPDHGETYASTASFLLRLLVDDRHVCLVAVAKPIPEPATPLPDLSGTRKLDAPITPGVAAAGGSSGVASPAVGTPIEGLKSLHLATAAATEQDGDDGNSSSGEAGSSLSSSPQATSSVFSTATEQAAEQLSHSTLAPIAPHTRMISPRDAHGRINNTPATSVFSDIFAERGLPTHKFTLDDLPGPTEPTDVVKRVLSIPPARSREVETETILGVVSAQLSVVSAASEDSLFSSVKEEASSIVEVHLLTLATAPEERGQGLGAKLLSSLHAECMVKARFMALKSRSRGRTGPLPVVQPITPTFTDESPLATPANESFLQNLQPGPSLVSLRDATPAKGTFLVRTHLEVHPSNIHALSLYRAHGFSAPHDDAKAIKRGFYRGDVRIAARERTKRGGTDAWVLERWDGLLSDR